MNKKHDVTASIVVYNTSIEELEKTIQAYLSTSLNVSLVIVDNAQSHNTKKCAEKYQAHYIATDKNLGFGVAHNIAIDRLAKDSKYFLILNPDVVILEDALLQLFNFMEGHEEVPLSAPLIYNLDLSIQRVHKRLPSFHILFARRFITKVFKNYAAKENAFFEMHDIDFSKKVSTPNLSGCFMFFRSSSLQEVKGFDERYFMYFDDVDISRRANELGPTVIVPEAKVLHRWERGSHKSLKLTCIHISSAFKYFMKWGFNNKSNVYYYD